MRVLTDRPVNYWMWAATRGWNSRYLGPVVKYDAETVTYRADGREVSVPRHEVKFVDPPSSTLEGY